MTQRAGKRDYALQRGAAAKKERGGEREGLHAALCYSYFFLGGTTASLKDFDKRNFTTVLAGILM
ncbi:MAG: hypothetical protein ACRD22_20395, partial [Terriglobia bacterium]